MKITIIVFWSLVIIGIMAASWWIFPAHTYVTGTQNGKTCISFKEPFRWGMQYKCL